MGARPGSRGRGLLHKHLTKKLEAQVAATTAANAALREALESIRKDSGDPAMEARCDAALALLDELGVPGNTGD